jgi:hypothetical protein
MNKFLSVVILLLVAGNVYVFSRLLTQAKPSPQTFLQVATGVSPSPHITPTVIPNATKLSDDACIEKIRNMAEVKEFFKESVHPTIGLDTENSNEAECSVHVFEDESTHVSTFGWYLVNRVNGEVKKDQ